jgi:membrane protein
MYWAALTLGPLMMAASIAITSYVVTISRGWAPGLANLPGVVTSVLVILQFAILAGSLTILYRYVPNTPVRWFHAGTGGILACLGLTLMRQAMGWYLSKIPTYSVIYGAFATLPILLLWIYLSWLIVLFGAAIAAYLPSLLHGFGQDNMRHGGKPGWDFQLALEIVQQLDKVRTDGSHGLTTAQMALALQTDELLIKEPLQTLETLDWVGALATRTENEPPRYTLLADPAVTALEPLVERLLIDPEPQLGTLIENIGVKGWMLSDALQRSSEITGTKLAAG